MTEKTKQWYACNPSKNFECSQTSCHLNGGPCFATSKPKYAYRTSDGEPIKVKLKKGEFVIDYD